MTDPAVARKVALGDYVKVSRDGQRMWFEVVGESNGRIVGRLDSVPANNIEWALGDLRELPMQSSRKRHDLEMIEAAEVLDWLRP